MSKLKKMMPEDIFVSTIILGDQSTKKLDRTVEEISETLSTRYSNFEIIIIDNFIQKEEMNKVVVLLDKLPCIRLIRLSKTITKDTAVFAGLEAAIGDHVLIMIPTSDPVRLIPTIIKKNKSADIVFGLSKKSQRKGFLNKYGAELFYWYNKKYLGITIPARSTYFMAFNRRAVNALTRSRRHARHIRYLARQVGYRMDEIVYEPKAINSQKKSMKELLTTALELTTNYSHHPLRFVAWIGAGAALLNFIYCLYVVLVRAFKGHIAEGWTSLSLQTSIMFLFVFLILAILSEYVGKILAESRNEPAYHIMDELTSRVSVADATRRNITR